MICPGYGTALIVIISEIEHMVPPSLQGGGNLHVRIVKYYGTPTHTRLIR